MKKVSLLACLLLLSFNYTQPNIKLSSPLLRIADNAGIFNGPILDILLTRLDIIALVKGEKEWNGSIMKLVINENEKLSLSAYCRRPEIIFGATFVTITPDHKLVNALTTKNQKASVDQFLATVKNKSLYDRQMNSTLHGVFTGSHAINPVSKELLPIYISDYAVECFDSRHSQTRIGFPAHVSKDFDFAKHHKLPIKLVVTITDNLNDNAAPVAAPLFDKNNVLKEAYLGEYRECILTQSGFLNNINLKDAAALIIQYLENNDLGTEHKELLQYQHNHKTYNINDLSKIESLIHKDSAPSANTIAQQNELQITLIHVQADFLEIVEKFLVNIRNTKTLMIALIEESCMLRKNPDCYLLRWAHFTGNETEKDVFRRDINSIKDLKKFCKDLLDFLSDLAHSCPNALKSISQ